MGISTTGLSGLPQADRRRIRNYLYSHQQANSTSAVFEYAGNDMTILEAPKAAFRDWTKDEIYPFFDIRYEYTGNPIEYISRFK
jgi:hypothetical protein